MTSAPTKPSTTTPMRLGVIFSPRKNTAMKASQIGMVNSSANTVASGSNVRLSAQTYCEAK